ncbi:major facilitator superfamily domain-containing protein [Armillaria nabsnona]|nr:major facilitator superfamily domain-containing protein [Armillaria nabsnona]
MSLHDKHDIDSEKHTGNSAPSVVLQEEDVDLATFHELHTGRLVIDPAYKLLLFNYSPHIQLFDTFREAKAEFGEIFASKLKLSRDGTKSIHLFIVMLASIVPDFDGGIGIAAIFRLPEQYNTTTGVINNLTFNWLEHLSRGSVHNTCPRHQYGLTANSIQFKGWGGIFAVVLIRRYGHLPVLFWLQVLALGFLMGCTFALNLATFAGMRCLTGFFATVPQVTLNFWTMGFIISPHLSPFAFGFLVSRQSWRWAYGIGCIYSAIICVLIALFLDETMYDRTVKPIPEPHTTGFCYRIKTLVGITGIKMARYRVSWKESILSPINVVWRPHLLGILLFEGALFGFGIGINVTNAVFLGSPAPVGFRWSQDAVSGAYGMLIVSVLLGELIGWYTNDWIMNISIRRNHGVFEAESRLWGCYIALPLYICGFVTLGASIQNHLNTGAVIMGWGIAELAIMINTVAIYAYCNDCFLKHQGEISALINLARALRGFGVAYFQVPWAEKHGALQTFGCEATIIAGLFVLIIPTIQIHGRSLRERFSVA